MIGGKKNFIVNSVKAITILIMITHFILTFIYVMPLTPIKLEHQEFLNNTIGTFFPQNWSLFAPNPVSRNESLLVSCISEESPLSDIKQLDNNGWEDITAPLWQAHQRNRFTVYDRIERTQGSGIRQFFGALPELANWRESCEKGNEESCKIYEERTKQVSKRGEQKLVKIASSYCRETNTKKIGQVAIRIRVDTYLSWSKRYTDKKENLDTDVGIFPIDDAVVLSGLYQSKRGAENNEE